MLRTRFQVNRYGTVNINYSVCVLLTQQEVFKWLMGSRKSIISKPVAPFSIFLYIFKHDFTKKKARIWKIVFLPSNFVSFSYKPNKRQPNGHHKKKEKPPNKNIYIDDKIISVKPSKWLLRFPNFYPVYLRVKRSHYAAI